MDAISMLAKKAADQPVEKQAAGFGRFLRSAINTGRQGFNLAKPLVSSGGKFSLGRAAASAGGAGLGAGAYNVATAPSTGEGSLGWQHQAIKGEDYGAGARGWFSPTAWGRAAMSPVKSVASMFANDGPDKVTGGWTPSGGTTRYNPATGQDELVGGKVTRSVTWSPRAQGLQSQYGQAEKSLSSMEAAQKAKIADMQKKWQGMGGSTDFRKYKTPAEASAAMQHYQDMQAAREALKSRQYGGGGFFGGPNAAKTYEQMQELKGRMGDIGMVARRAAAAAPRPAPRPGPVPTVPGTPRRSSPDDIYDALRMSAYSP